jgi:hypothetical protein
MPRMGALEKEETNSFKYLRVGREDIINKFCQL